MALLHLAFESEYMGANQDVNIIVPDKPRTMTTKEFYNSEKKYPVLWLLHGTFGGYDDWIRKSNIELYACEKNLIVVMPGIGNSDYEAWDNFTLGLNSDKYIVEELMPLVYNWLPASSKREDNFVAGLSMGGGGTVKFAIKYPELFAKAASLSFAPRPMDERREWYQNLFDKKRTELDDPTDVMHMNKRIWNQMHRFDTLDEYLDSDSNVYRHLFEKLEAGADLPELLFTCGSEDPLMTVPFEELEKKFAEKGYAGKFVEGPGSHEWRVWERDIQIALDFFGLNEDEQGNAF